jgi:hypothetical protein
MTGFTSPTRPTNLSVAGPDDDDYQDWQPVGYYERFVMDEDEEVPDRPYTFVCTACLRDVDQEPCPDHAPLAPPPGLRLVECAASPRHWMFVHDRDDYGAPCPQCRLDDYYQKERLARQCRHWPWRRWPVLRWTWRYVLDPLGLTKGTVWTTGDGHRSCMTMSWRWHLLPAVWRRSR